MPKCGHILRRDVTANLLSTILSLWLFHYKLGTRFNFSTRDVCFSDHHTSTLSLSLSLSLSLTLAEWVCPLREKMVLFTANLPTLKKHLAPDPELIFFFSPTIKGVSAATNQKLACKQKHNVCKSMQPSKKIAVKMWNFSGGIQLVQLSGIYAEECVIWVWGVVAAIVHPR